MPRKRTISFRIDPQLADRLHEATKPYYGKHGACLSAAMLMFLEADPKVQAEYLARMYEAGPNGRQAGLEMAQEILLHAYTRYAGVYLMPSFGRYELCASVLDVLPGFGAANVAKT